MIERLTMLDAVVIGDAAGPTIHGPWSGYHGLSGIVVEASFVYGADGTDVTAHLQTSLDGGANWIDIMAFLFATTTLRSVMAVEHGVQATPIAPLDVGLADDTVQNLIIGDRFQVSLTTVGNYTGVTTLTMNMLPKTG